MFRKAKSRAAGRGRTLGEFVTEAREERLAATAGKARRAEPQWMQGFGRLRRLRKETRRIQAKIDEAFGRVEPEDRA